jgi:hypothetical protein
MKPSEYVKQELGISLKEASKISEQSEQTLINWYNNPKKRKVFELVIKGIQKERV